MSRRLLVCRLPHKSWTKVDFMTLAGYCGVPWNLEKLRCFASIQCYIGFDWNLERKLVSFPPDKLGKNHESVACSPASQTQCQLSTWGNASTSFGFRNRSYHRNCWSVRHWALGFKVGPKLAFNIGWAEAAAAKLRLRVALHLGVISCDHSKKVITLFDRTLCRHGHCNQQGMISQLRDERNCKTCLLTTSRAWHALASPLHSHLFQHCRCPLLELINTVRA